MFAALTRVVVDTIVIGVVLFAGAGTIAWPRAWILLDVLLILRAATVVAVHRLNPELVRERATRLWHRDQPLTDRGLLFTYMTLAFIGVPLVAAVDVFRWRVFPPPPSVVQVLGLVLFASGWLTIALALRANAFAVVVVRKQDDRAHRVVDSGVYGVVRHPMYAAVPMVLAGLSLWLGSWTAALASIVPVSILIARLLVEERFLRRELPGYPQYVERVRYRLLPGIW